MDFQFTYVTDKGTVKKENQDSLLAVKARTGYGPAAFAVLCDGMGGLARGELASAEAVQAFSRWFRERFFLCLDEGLAFERLKEEWELLITELNGRILNYGKRNRVSLGTTATGLLLACGKCFGFHVGDSRAYEMAGGGITQITKDQTVVQRDVDRGLMTQEEAAKSPRRNVLLQCVGASPFAKAEFFQRKIPEGGRYLLCSDGFVHELSQEEMCGAFSAGPIAETAVRGLVETAKERGERDNITALLVWQEERP